MVSEAQWRIPKDLSVDKAHDDGTICKTFLRMTPLVLQIKSSKVVTLRKHSIEDYYRIIEGRVYLASSHMANSQPLDDSLVT